MSELVEFLTAMLDADEAVAHNALHPDAVEPGVWVTENHDSKYHEEPNRAHIAEDRHGHYWSVAHEVFIPNAEHMARHDPARVLAAVAAARARLHMYDAVEMTDPTTAAMLRKVEALPYADHPDYRQEWKP